MIESLWVVGVNLGIAGGTAMTFDSAMGKYTQATPIE